jgi:gliding motility-associated lipoprotein GldD
MRKKLGEQNIKWRKTNRSLFIIHCSLFTILLLSCNSTFVPKPRGFFKIDLPRHQYQTFNGEGYPYSFEYPTYAKVLKDTNFFGEKAEPYWINIDFPQFAGRMYISYKDIGKNDFSKMVNDAFALTYKHTSKATGIDDSVLSTPNGVHGIFFKVGGNAATARQFFLTDSTKHFLRGALYFDATPNEDSLRVVNNFLQEDLLHLINTFKWR